MLTKEIRIEDAVVVVAVNEETRVLDVMVNGERVQGGELKDEIDAQGAIDDFGEDEARGAVGLWNEKAFFAEEHMYAISKSFDTLGGAFTFTLKAESEGDHFVIFEMTENGDEPHVVWQSRKELNEPTLAAEQINKFDEEIANQLTLMVVFNGGF